MGRDVYKRQLYMSDGAEVKKGDMICEWDPYNAVIISEHEGKAVYDSVIEGVTCLLYTSRCV